MNLIAVAVLVGRPPWSESQRWEWFENARPDGAIASMRRDVDATFLAGWPGSRDASKLWRVAKRAWDGLERQPTRLGLATYFYASHLASVVDQDPSGAAQQHHREHIFTSSQLARQLHAPENLDWNFCRLISTWSTSVWGMPRSDQAFFRRQAKACLTRYKGEPVAEMLSLSKMYFSGLGSEQLEVIKLAEQYEAQYGWRKYPGFRVARCSAIVGAARDQNPEDARKSLAQGKKLCDEYFAAGFHSLFMKTFVKSAFDSNERRAASGGSAG